MIPEELVQQAKELFPDHQDIFTLEVANNYILEYPDGDPNDFLFYCSQIAYI